MAARGQRPGQAGRSVAPDVGVVGFFVGRARAPLPSYEPKTHSQPLPRVLVDAVWLASMILVLRDTKHFVAEIGGKNTSF